MAEDTSFTFRAQSGDVLSRRAHKNDDDDLSLYVIDEVVPSGVTAETGSGASMFDVGPFIPILGRPIIASTTGTGTVSLLRSVDGGTTKLPITLGGVAWAQGWTSPINEPLWVETEAGVSFYLRCTPSAGTMSGRLAQ